MTVVAQAIKATSVYSASFTFTFFFRLLAEADVVVLHIDQSTPVVVRILTLATDYTVSASPWPTGGSISIVAGDQSNWTVGDTVVIYRNMPLSQVTDYIENDPFPAETHEQTVDISRMLDQELDELLNRALAYPIDSALGLFYDADSRLISNVLDPVSDQDAATRGWINLTFAALPDVLAGPAGPQSPINRLTDIVTATPPTTELVTGGYSIFDLDGTDELAVIGFGGGSVLQIINRMHGGAITLFGEDAASGASKALFSGDPDGNAGMYNNGVLHLQAVQGGARVLSASNSDAENRNIAFTHNTAVRRAVVGHGTSDVFVVRNEIHGGNLLFTAEDGAGVVRTIINGNPDGTTIVRADTDLDLQVNAGDVALRGRSGGSTGLFNNNIEKLRTASETAADQISGCEVLNAAGVLKPVGLGVIEDDATAFGSGAQTPFQQINAGEVIEDDETVATSYTTYANTGTDQTNIPNGAQWEVKKTNTGVLTILGGASVTLTWFDGGGAAPPTGTRTLARGGRCIIRKVSDSAYEIWGVGLT